MILICHEKHLEARLTSPQDLRESTVGQSGAWSTFPGETVTDAAEGGQLRVTIDIDKLWVDRSIKIPIGILESSVRR